MGTGRGHEYTAPNQAKNAGITPNNPKKKGGLSASENPIGIETLYSQSNQGRQTRSQRIRKPDRD